MDTKLLELGVDGGSITVFIKLENHHKGRYYYLVNEMYDDDIEILDLNKNAIYSFTFIECMLKLMAKYTVIFYFHPLYIHKDYCNQVLFLLNDYLKVNQDNSHLINKEIWTEKLKQII